MTKTQEDTASVAQYTCGLFIKVKTLNIVSLVKVNSIQCFELGHYIYKAECSGILDKIKRLRSTLKLSLFQQCLTSVKSRLQ